MLISDIRNMTDEDILNQLEDAKEGMFRFRLQKASGELKDSNTMRRAQRDIARMKTVLRERQLAAAHVATKEGK
jgi:large subunit ribosomal protein L29